MPEQGDEAMGVSPGGGDYKDRKPILVALGVLMLLVGLVAAFFGPIEIYCFYLFSAGGPFHYEGFGFGSFMFGNIACQIAGYYLVAAVLIPLGYGHVAVRRWACALSVAGLWLWLVVGVPLIVVFLFMLLSIKELSLAMALVVFAALALSYLAIPGLLIRFYRSRDVQLTFEARDPRTYGVEAVPVPILVLVSLYVLYALVLHVGALFNGFFPLFGTLWVGLEGFFLLDVAILWLAVLAWSTWRQRPWAWWGGLMTFGLVAPISVVTLARASLADLLAVMTFPPTEMEILSGLPVQGVHLAVMVGLPLVITAGLVVASRRYFGRDGH